jgi:5-formyltetrahydrofolate cyclo-ligase
MSGLSGCVTSDGLNGVLPLSDPWHLLLNVEAYGASLEGALARMIQVRRAVRPAPCALDAAQGLAEVFLDQPWARRLSCVAMYESRWPEPGTRALRCALAARGVTVLLARNPGRGELDWVVDRLAIAAQARGPATEPDAEDETPPSLQDAEVVLVPAFAVDTLGTRLGRASDGYSQALRRVAPTVPVLAVINDHEILDAALAPLLLGPDSIAVTGALTPTRLLPFGAVSTLR